MTKRTVAVGAAAVAAALPFVVAMNADGSAGLRQTCPPPGGSLITFSDHRPVPGRVFVGATVHLPPRDCYRSVQITCHAAVAGELDNNSDGIVFTGGEPVRSVLRFYSVRGQDAHRGPVRATCGWRIPRWAGGQLLSLISTVPCSDADGCDEPGVTVVWDGGASLNADDFATWRIRPKLRPSFSVASVNPLAGTEFRPISARIPQPQYRHVSSVGCDAKLGGHFVRVGSARMLVGGNWLGGSVERAYTMPDRHGRRHVASLSCGWFLPRSSAGKLLSLETPGCVGDGCCADCDDSAWGMSIAYWYDGWSNPEFPSVAQFRHATWRVAAPG